MAEQAGALVLDVECVWLYVYAGASPLQICDAVRTR